MTPVRVRPGHAHRQSDRRRDHRGDHRAVPGDRRALRPPALVAACVALAAASLALPYEPVYDAWAWLVWGKELGGLDLDLSAGPSWKPLPVLVTTPLAAFGDAAPALWLVVARAGWLYAIVLAGELAWRLAAGRGRGERVAAAAFASLSLLLLADSFTPWLRQAAGGLSEPLLVALVLAAVRAGLDDRPRLALVLGALAGLLRPEAWPLLALYAAWQWRGAPSTRAVSVALAAALPALWLGPDLLSAGDALTGAGRAREVNGPVAGETSEAIGRAAAMPLAAAWPLALLALAGRDRRLLVLAAGAAGWVAVVAVMAGAGYAGLPRFMAPAAAMAGVLGGVGLARALGWARGVAAATATSAGRGGGGPVAPATTSAVRRGRGPVAPVLAATVVVLAAAVQMPWRAADLEPAARTAAHLGRSLERLRALTDAVGREPFVRCGRITTSELLAQTPLAWELDVPLGRIAVSAARRPAPGALVLGPTTFARLRAYAAVRGRPLGVRGEWSAYSTVCPAGAATDASASRRIRSAGVSGARR